MNTPLPTPARGLSKAPQRRGAFTRNAALVSPLALAASLLVAVAGCGGSSGHPGTSLTDTGSSAPAASDRSARATITVTWPAPTRDVPNAAQTIFVTVADEAGACVAGDDTGCAGPSLKLTQTSGATTASGTLLNLPSRRPLEFSINAYANAPVKPDGITPNTSVDAKGWTPVSYAPYHTDGLVAGATTGIDVRLTSTIGSLQVSADGVVLGDNKTVPTPSVSFGPTDASATKTFSLSAWTGATGGTSSVVLLHADGRDPVANPQIQWSVKTTDATPVLTNAFTLTAKGTADPLTGTAIDVTRFTEEAGAYTLSYGYYPNTAAGVSLTANISGTVTLNVGQATLGLLTALPSLGYSSVVGTNLDISFDGSSPVLLTQDNVGNSIILDGGISYGGTNTSKPPPTPILSSLTKIATANGYTGFVGVTPTVFDPQGKVVTPANVVAYQQNLAAVGNIANTTATLPVTSIGGNSSSIITDIAGQRAGATGTFYALVDGSKIAKLTVSGSKITPASVSSALDYSGLFLDVENDTTGTTYLASPTAVYRYASGSTSADTKFSLQFPAITAAYNPSGETLGTIKDIAVDGAYLYVLAKVGSETHVHVFHSSNGKWLYSIKANANDQTNLNNATANNANNGVAISANNGVAVVAYKNGNVAGTLQFRNPHTGP